jgi:ribosomal protein S27AE
MSIFGPMRGMGGGSADAVRQSAEAAGAARSAERKAADLEEQVDKLTLVCAALWDLVKEKTALTEEDLIARIAVVDARDGVADGKITHKARPCEQCGRSVAARHYKCLYCGTEQKKGGVFERL